MRNLLTLPRFVLTVGIAIYVLTVVSLAEDKNTSDANVSSIPVPSPPSSQPYRAISTPTYGTNMAPGYNPYGSIAPPATAPYYAPPAIAPPSGYAPQAHPYTPYPYTNPKEELQRRYAAMMDEYGRLLSQDLPD